MELINYTRGNVEVRELSIAYSGHNQDSTEMDKVTITCVPVKGWIMTCLAIRTEDLYEALELFTGSTCEKCHPITISYFVRMGADLECQGSISLFQEIALQL